MATLPISHQRTIPGLPGTEVARNVGLGLASSVTLGSPSGEGWDRVGIARLLCGKRVQLRRARR